MSVKCPGQDTRNWRPEDVFESQCPACGRGIEFFKDDPWRSCRECGYTVRNPRLDLGCAEWCPHAKACLGTVPGGVPLAGEADRLLADRLIAALREHFGGDRRRMLHALAVLDEARRLLPGSGADPMIVTAAAILHDVGIPEAERKHDSAAGRYQEIEGPPIAREILGKLEIDPRITEEICRIIGNHHTGKNIDTVEFRVLWDADHIVNLPEAPISADRIERVFRTERGRQRAAELVGR